MNSVTVSVIMRTYNRRALLQRAIRSVRDQIFEDWELIVVNDCSTDGSAMTLGRFQELDRRIRVVHRPVNSRKEASAVEPMNDGLSLAQGRFIAYLDDDNQWERSYLKEMIGILSKRPELALVYCDTKDFVCSAVEEQRLDERSSYIVSHDCIVLPHEPTFRGYELFPSGKGYRDYIDTNEMVHTRAALDAVGGCWPLRHEQMEEINRVQQNSYRVHNDLALVEKIRAAHGVKALHYHPRALAIFINRDHPAYEDGNSDFREAEARGSVRLCA